MWLILGRRRATKQMVRGEMGQELSAVCNLNRLLTAGRALTGFEWEHYL
jgi:hypothetical protein